MLPLVYHPAYNIKMFGLERLHPFDGRKYQRIHDALISRGLRRRGDFVRPGKISRGDLLRVHTPEYLGELRRPASLARERAIPVALVLSGGYSPQSWRIHCDGIEGILTRFDRG